MQENPEITCWSFFPTMHAVFVNYAQNMCIVFVPTFSHQFTK